MDCIVGTWMGNCRVQESAAHRISMSTERGKVCGIDVHKGFLVATILYGDGNYETRRLQQNTASLLEFPDWIISEGCDSVDFESTGDSILVSRSGESDTRYRGNCASHQTCSRKKD